MRRLGRQWYNFTRLALVGFGIDGEVPHPGRDDILFFALVCRPFRDATFAHFPATNQQQRFFTGIRTVLAPPQHMGLSGMGVKLASLRTRAGERLISAHWTKQSGMVQSQDRCKSVAASNGCDREPITIYMAMH